MDGVLDTIQRCNGLRKHILLTVAILEDFASVSSTFCLHRFHSPTIQRSSRESLPFLF
ncbi:MAG: hypothetical protein LZF62_360208 [Nitrospira sp.]|nr:MAG: hypothetical protein LZF62_360208 [Nitrospira sp.]